ncbi:MAG: alpha/beta hydrolase, partial [Nitrososphaera sp.]
MTSNVSNNDPLELVIFFKYSAMEAVISKIIIIQTLIMGIYLLLWIIYLILLKLNRLPKFLKRTGKQLIPSVTIIINFILSLGIIHSEVAEFNNNYAKVTIFYATDRENLAAKSKQFNDFDNYYGNKRGTLELGKCEISIPRDHKMGEIESPTIRDFNIFELAFTKKPEKHIVLLNIKQFSNEAFWNDFNSQVASSKKKHALVFVHGFDNSFKQAALRTAQMAYDLGFDGAPILYSWPSQANRTLLGYLTDENNVAWTVMHLKASCRRSHSVIRFCSDQFHSLFRLKKRPRSEPAPTGVA